MTVTKSAFFIVVLLMVLIQPAVEAVCQEKKKAPKKTTKPAADLLEFNAPLEPPIPEAILPKGDTFTIETEKGDVTVKNFFKGREKEVTSSGIRVVCFNDSEECQHSIYFNWEWKGFAITLMRTPLQKVRDEAEQSLLDSLNISREDACRLNVQLNVANGIDSEYDGGADYGLSFCPNGIPFHATVSSATDWTEINVRQKKGAFHFSPSRLLIHDGKPITGVRFGPGVKKIAISPPDPSGKYLICLAFDYLDSSAFLIKLDRHTGRKLDLDGPPYVWTKWSPSGTHAILGSYYEADEALYSINLATGLTRKFDFKVAKLTEEASCDLDTFNWIDDKVFRVSVSVNCNPYTDERCSDETRKKVLRTYEIRADSVTAAVFAERIRQ